MTHYLLILVLVALFVAATVVPVNLGVPAFAAAFVLGPALVGVSVDDVLGEFPADLFVIVVGITLLFGVAQANGTIDVVVDALLKVVGGRRWAIVWLMFVLGAILMSLGSVLAVGMLAPVAMPIARRYGIDPLLMGMMICHGVLGAAFSPINVYGAFVGGWLAEAGLQADPGALFLIPLGLNLVMAVVLFLVRGRDLLRRDADITVEVQGPTERTPLTPLRLLTLVGMVGLLVSAAVFRVDVGIAAMCIAAALLLIAPKRHKAAYEHINWSATLLVCGMLTYMAVLEANGTLDYFGRILSGLGTPLLTAVLLCLAVAAMSAIGSSLATLGIVLPLAAPMLVDGRLPVLALVAALAFCAVVVDVSPFAANGVMVLANAHVDDRVAFQRRLLRYCGSVVVTAPLLAGAAVLLPAVLVGG